MSPWAITPQGDGVCAGDIETMRPRVKMPVRVVRNADFSMSFLRNVLRIVQEDENKAI
jgi:hypothetical protein